MVGDGMVAPSGRLFCVAEKTSSQVVGRNLARIRREMGMTSRVLAASTSELGVPLSSSGISDIEKGRRTVSVDQLTCLAACLGVSPIALLNPETSDPDATVELSGTSPETAAAALTDWLRGEKSLTDELLDDFEREKFRRTNLPEWMWNREGMPDGG